MNDFDLMTRALNRHYSVSGLEQQPLSPDNTITVRGTKNRDPYLVRTQDFKPVEIVDPWSGQTIRKSQS